MDCPKCGEKMEKGCISFLSKHRVYDRLCLNWFSDKKINKYGKSIKWLLTKCDYKIYGTRSFIGDDRLVSYRCKNCGAILVIPPENDENV